MSLMKQGVNKMCVNIFVKVAAFADECVLLWMNDRVKINILKIDKLSVFSVGLSEEQWDSWHIFVVVFVKHILDLDSLDMID